MPLSSFVRDFITYPISRATGTLLVRQRRLTLYPVSRQNNNGRVSDPQIIVSNPNAGPPQFKWVTLYCPTPGATILYTLGVEFIGNQYGGTSGAIQYTGPFQVTSITTVRAKSFRGSFSSDEVTREVDPNLIEGGGEDE